MDDESPLKQKSLKAAFGTNFWKFFSKKQELMENYREKKIEWI